MTPMASWYYLRCNQSFILSISYQTPSKRALNRNLVAGVSGTLSGSQAVSTPAHRSMKVIVPPEPLHGGFEIVLQARHVKTLIYIGTRTGLAQVPVLAK